jgi:Kdo2-lipid IVA lauroyltransferase/acyltransferase
VARWVGTSARVSVFRNAPDKPAPSFPALTGVEIEGILSGMWENFGRVAAEYPHLCEIRIFEPGERIET